MIQRERSTHRESSPQPPYDVQLKGVILAAGLGTRLRPLTELYPKPLVQVGGRPLIEWGLISLMEAGIDEVGINTHYRGDQLHAHFSEVRCADLARAVSPERPPLTLSWSPEEELLGTGGGVRALWEVLFGTDSLGSSPAAPSATRPGSATAVLCLNGDALFDFSLCPLISAHVAGSGAVSTLALREVAPGDPFGRVGVDAEGRVVRIAEVEGPRAREEVKVGAFTGAQIIGEETAKLLSPVFSDTFRTAHRDLLARDVEVRAHFVEPQSLWLDIGNLERYLGAHRALLERPESPLWRYVPAHRRQGDNIIFEGAELSEGIALGENVWVGAGATISVEGERALELSECVIWDHSSVELKARVPQPQPQRVGRVITPDLQL